jgi:UDP-glucose 4-epimerase
MNALVIGGNGFIGSHLVDSLLQKGHSVRVFDMGAERFRVPLKGVDYRLSTLDNRADLYEAMLGIDVVYHLASASVPSTSGIDTILDIQKNVIPAMTILDLVVKRDIKRFVYFSSGGAVYGNPLTIPVSEEHPLRPISSYGIVKVTIEHYLELYQRVYGLQPLILRPSNPYGPRQGHYLAQGVISTFLRKVKMNEPLVVFGDGSAVKDYIYITDLVEQCCDLSVTDVTGAYNIGSGQGTSLNEILELIRKITKRDLKIEYIPTKVYDVSRFVLDTTKASNARKKIVPLTTLEAGMRKLWEWMGSELG